MNLYHIGLPGLDLGPPVHAPVDEDVVFYEDGVVLLLGPATILVFLPFIEVWGGGGGGCENFILTDAFDHCGSKLQTNNLSYKSTDLSSKEREMGKSLMKD